MSVIVATAYMDEAQDFDWLAVMDQGQVLATGTPAALLARTGASSLESAFIALLPDIAKRGIKPCPSRRWKPMPTTSPSRPQLDHALR
jgi:ribosome-dependent ATPase